MPFFAIAAMSENRVIGNQGKIPWHLPEDFRWFKQKTMGGTLVMGRKTFASIGKPLPGRKTLVLSRTMTPLPEIEVVRDWESLLAREPDLPKPAFITGGAEIYQIALPYCQELFLTRVKKQCEGNAFFPPFEHLFQKEEILQDNADFAIVRYYK